MTEVFRLDRVSKKYVNDGREFLALKDVSLSIAEGEIFGIIGMSGAGKSTLVRTLNRLEDVTSGTISFYGQDLGSLNARDVRKVRRNIAMIFQSFNLLQQRSVLSNVMQPLRIAGVRGNERKEKALEMLRVVGLEDKKDEYPSRLSGGQRQRVAIARALAHRPRLILADEPTAELDSAMAARVATLFAELCKKEGISILMTTHDVGLMGAADYLIELENGERIDGREE